MPFATGKKKPPTMSRFRRCQRLPSFLADPQCHNLYHISPSAHARRRRAGEPIADEIDKLIGGEAVRAQHMLCAALRVAISEQVKRTATVGLGQAATDRIAGRHGARVIGHAELAKRIMRPRLRRGVGSQGTAAVRFEPSNPNELLTFALRNP
jgi:hypothetical protein